MRISDVISIGKEYLILGFYRPIYAFDAVVDGCETEIYVSAQK